MEILLSYIEFIQYKYNVSKLLNITLDENKSNELDIFKNVPKSIIYDEIIDNESDQMFIKRIAYGLHIKYVKRGGEYEININHPSRLSLMNLMNNENNFKENVVLNNNELFCIFDDCITQMAKLLRYSLSRLRKRKKQIKLIEEALNNN